MSDTTSDMYLLHSGDICLILHFGPPHHFTLQHLEVCWAPRILRHDLCVSAVAMISVGYFELFFVQDEVRVRLESLDKLSEVGEVIVLQ